MTRLWRPLLLLVLFFCVGLSPAQAKRVALVIGNDNYASVATLQKAGNDAGSIAHELRAAGFEVLLHRDLNYRAMVKAVEALLSAITGGDEVVFFFAGHGVQIKSGSYLLPVDIEANSESEVERTAYALNDLLEQLGQAKAGFSLVMIDACRDNPLKSKGRSVGGTGRGLAAPEPPKGQMVIYSASRGQQALDRLSDNDKNPNSVFTREFASRMRRPGLKLEDLVREVQDAVEVSARSVSYEQRPAMYNESRGSFYFFNPLPPQGGTTAMSEAEREDRFWEDTKTAGNREGFEAYLELYQRGRYANLARANISRLSASTVAALSPAAGAAQARATGPSPDRTHEVLAPRPASGPGAASTPAAATAPAASAAPSAPVPGTAPAAEAAPAGPAVPGTTRVTMPNGDRYEGETLGIIRTGQGVYTFVNGDRYEGQFADNRFNGKGILTRADGDRYEGGFTNSQPNGRGIHKFKSGEIYEGDFKMGVKQGQGSYSYPNGDRYEGPFVNNEFSGKGRFSFGNGDRYEGEFRNHVRDGEGVMRFANGDRYEGQFVQGVQSGKGRYFYASGDRYEGSFVGGVPSGTGVYFYAKGDRYEGQFVAGVRHGKGVYHFADGQQRDFEFVQGQEKTAASGPAERPAAGSGG